jgi:hypothetical protein
MIPFLATVSANGAEAEVGTAYSTMYCGRPFDAPAFVACTVGAGLERRSMHRIRRRDLSMGLIPLCNCARCRRGIYDR